MFNYSIEETSPNKDFKRQFELTKGQYFSKFQYFLRTCSWLFIW